MKRMLITLVILISISSLAFGQYNQKNSLRLDRLDQENAVKHCNCVPDDIAAIVADTTITEEMKVDLVLESIRSSEPKNLFMQKSKLAQVSPPRKDFKIISIPIK